MGQREEHGRLSGKDRLEIRDRIHKGQTHSEVAAEVGCSTKSIQRLSIRTGGLPSRSRNRSPKHLTLADIQRGLTAHLGSAPIVEMKAGDLEADQP